MRAVKLVPKNPGSDPVVVEPSSGATAGLHASTVLQLRRLIVEGTIAPGAKLNERELTQRLGVSRTPLREAIKLLAAEGLVDLLPNRGAVAVHLTEEDIVHSFEVLADLEALAGELAVQRITTEEFAEIQALHYEMLAAHARQDLSSYYAINARIHLAINAVTKNPVLAKVYASVNARVQSLRFGSNQDREKWNQAVKEHQSMIEALAERDAAKLRQILIAHVHTKRDAALRIVRARTTMAQSTDIEAPPAASDMPKRRTARRRASD